jgi:hypothetical protein
MDKFVMVVGRMVPFTQTLASTPWSPLASLVTLDKDDKKYCSSQEWLAMYDSSQILLVGGTL